MYSYNPVEVGQLTSWSDLSVLPLQPNESNLMSYNPTPTGTAHRGGSVGHRGDSVGHRTEVESETQSDDAHSEVTQLDT